MSKTQWEYHLVELSFCEQIEAMGWQCVGGDTDVLELTERRSFGEELLSSGQATAVLSSRVLLEMAR